MSEKKKIEVFDNCKEEIKCDVALAQVNELGMNLYVTTLKTIEDTQTAEINANIFIPKENMLRFSYQIVSALKEYGEKYDATYGLTIEAEECDENET